MPNIVGTPHHLDPDTPSSPVKDLQKALKEAKNAVLLPIQRGFYEGNRIVDSDSYKPSHWLQMPPKTTGTFFYLSSRGSQRNYPASVFFGLQKILKQYFSTPITMEEVEEAKEIIEAHGEPFNYEGWKLLIARHGGKLPLRIRAVKEGTLVPNHNVLMTVETTDPDFYWLASYFETALMRVWYPITVATQSHYLRDLIYGYLETTADDADAEIDFKLHDFGSRGVSSQESAGIGGLAHLLSFKGSDTMQAILTARRFYNCKMPSFSIPAGEHSTFSAWGRENESRAYRNMLQQYAKPGATLAVVSDTWDIYNACEHIWGETLRQEVIDSGATVVIRPDSGDPVTVLCGNLIEIKADTYENFQGIVEDQLHEELVEITPHGECGGDLTKTYLWNDKYYEVNYSPEWNRHDKQYYYIDSFGSNSYTYKEVEATNESKGILRILAEKFGYTINSKGYKVLNYVRLIQGDGVNPNSIKEILETMKKNGFSATNLAFGMGGALLQKVDRDTLKMAYKCSSATIDGKEVDIYKDPITDPGKRSLKGRVDLGEDPETGAFITYNMNENGMKNGTPHPDFTQTIDYFLNGEVLVDFSLEEIRETLRLTRKPKYGTIGA